MELFFPVVNRFWEGPWEGEFLEPRRWLHDCELVYVSAGSCTILLGGARHELGTGTLVIIPPGLAHEAWTEAGGWVFRHCVHFDWLPPAEPPPPPGWPPATFDAGSYNPALAGAIPAGVRERLPLVAEVVPGPLLDALELLLRHLRLGSPGCQALLWPVLALLLSESVPGAARSCSGKTARAVLELKEHIERHYREPLGYRDFQAVAQLSKSYLCDAFKSFLGRPPMEYLNEVRLAHARRLLGESKLNVGEVADAVGFTSHNYFTRRFRDKFGIVPSAFIGRIENGFVGTTLGG